MDAADWRIGFHHALVDAIVQEGSPHDPTRDGFYGSTLPDKWVEIGPHVAAVGIDYANTPKPIEADWMEFGGTFDVNERVYGVDLELFLLDGTRFWYRYKGTISDLILAVVADKPCPGTGQQWRSIPGNRGARGCPVCHASARKLRSPTTLRLVPSHAQENGTDVDT